MSNELMSTSTILKQVTDNANFRFVDMIKDSEVTILIPSLNSTNMMYVNSNSVLKIFSLMANNEDIENICCTYVTCKINDASLYSDTENAELDPMFAELLNTCKGFTVIPTSTLDNDFQETLLMTDYSLKKISQMLNNDITNLSDYISVAILIFAHDELHEKQRSLNRLSLRANILEKYARTKPKVPFNGISLFDTDPHPSLRNPHEAIDQLNTYLTNIDNFIQGNPQIHLERKVTPILDLSEIINNKSGRSGSEINSNNNLNIKDNNAMYKNNRSYGHHKRLLLSRQKLSRTKKSSPMLYDSNKRDEGIKGLVGDDTSDDIGDVIHINSNMNRNSKAQRLKGKTNVNANMNRKSIKKESNDDNVLSNLYVLKDADGNCVLVPEKSFSMLHQAYDKGKIKSGTLIAVEGDDGKIIQVDSESIVEAIHNEDKKFVKVKDLFDKDVIVNKKEFLHEYEKTKQEGNNCIEMDDFSGQKAYIQLPQGSLNTQKIKLPKRLYYIHLAKIEMNEISNYYANTGEPL